MNKLNFIKRLVKECNRSGSEALSYSTLFSTRVRFLSIANSTDSNEQTGKEVRTLDQSNSNIKFAKMEPKTLKKPVLPIETPKLETSFARKIETITSFDVSRDTISWIHVDKNGLVLDWNYEKQAPLQSNDIFSFEETYERIRIMFAEKLPQKSSAYLFEQRKFKTSDLKVLQHILKMQRDELVLQCIIKQSFSSNDFEQKMFALDSNKVAKQFRLFLGGERVISSELLYSFLKTNNGPASDSNQTSTLKINCDLLQTPDDMKEIFFQSKQSVKEPLAKTYLQAACFLKILKDILRLYDQNHI